MSGIFATSHDGAVVLIQEEQRETNQKTCEVRVMPTNVASRSAADI